MSTVTKKELIDTIADATGQKRVVVKQIVQAFLDNIVVELGKGNRLEFRDFGVFEVKQRRARKAQNPRTLEPVWVAPKRTVKFKVGRLMKQTLDDADADDAEGLEFGNASSLPEAPPTSHGSDNHDQRNHDA
ncbi:MAG: HU family DNA-binding protein [Planctomycetota bacterium]